MKKKKKIYETYKCYMIKINKNEIWKINYNVMCNIFCIEKK